jgi:hypothetical protein
MTCRKILGENLGGCSVEELHSLELKIEKSLRTIRGKKVCIVKSFSFAGKDCLSYTN